MMTTMSRRKGGNNKIPCQWYSLFDLLKKDTPQTIEIIFVNTLTGYSVLRQVMIMMI